MLFVSSFKISALDLLGAASYIFLFCDWSRMAADGRGTGVASVWSSMAWETTETG